MSSHEGNDSKKANSIVVLDEEENQVEIVETPPETDEALEVSAEVQLPDDIEANGSTEGEPKVENISQDDSIEDVESIVEAEKVEQKEKKGKAKVGSAREVVDSQENGIYESGMQNPLFKKPSGSSLSRLTSRIHGHVAGFFGARVVNPIKKATGIETFDIWHLVLAVFVFLCFVMISTVPFMLTTMADTQVGVAYSPLSAKFQKSLIPSGGVRKKLWGGKVFIWPRTDQIIEYTLRPGSKEENEVDSRSQNTKRLPFLFCNSRDGLEIELELIAHIRIIESEIKGLTQKFGSFDQWFSFIANQIHSSVLNSCQSVTAFEFQSRRENVSDEMEELVRREVRERASGSIERLALLEIRRPAAFENALVDLENNRSIIALAEAEREAAIIRAETLLDIAANDVIRIIDTAEVDAEIIRIRGGHEAEILLDKVAQFSVVFEEVKVGNNLNVTETLAFIESKTLAESELVIATEALVNLDFKEL